MDDPLKPSTALLCKLGSLVTHYQEATGPSPHPADTLAIQSLQEDPEVIEWFDAMRERSLLSVPR